MEDKAGLDINSTTSATAKPDAGRVSNKTRWVETLRSKG
jgi:hypothetical protein